MTMINVSDMIILECYEVKHINKRGENMEEQKKKTRKTSTTKEKTAVEKTTKKASSTKVASSKKEVTPKSTTRKTKTDTAKKITEEPKTTKKATTKSKAVTKEVTKALKGTAEREAAKEQNVERVKEAREEARVVPVKKEVKVPQIEKSKENNKETKVVTMPKESKQSKVVAAQKITNNKNQIKKSATPVGTKKQEKRCIYISIGSIIVAIIIALLVIVNVQLAKHAYSVTKEKFAQQNVVENIDDEEQEIGTVINFKSELVTKLTEKITLTPNVVASIYKEGAFNEETISNGLKLRMAWAKVGEENKYMAKEGEQDIVAIEKAKIQESIQNIFGTQVQYKDMSFNNTIVNEFVSTTENQGVINYNNNLYTGKISEIEEENTSLIYQEIKKVVQYDDRIELYVNTAFIKAEDGKYSIYKNYANGFNNKLLEVTNEELFANEAIDLTTGEGTITVKQNSVLDSIREKLNTYSYTFRIDDSINEYYLSEFKMETNELQ